MEYHTSVLLDETIAFIKPCFEKLYSQRGKNKTQKIIDATLGMGGHTLAFLLKFPYVHIDAVDIDSVMIKKTKERLGSYQNKNSLGSTLISRVHTYNTWFDVFFSDLVKNQRSDIEYKAIFMDLGLSMYHFKESDRGFSRFSKNDKLDMRLEVPTKPTVKGTATYILSQYKEKDIADIFFTYGEEKKSRLWAKKIVLYRKNNPIITVGDLLHALELGKKPSDGKTITKIFQSLRIYVNKELQRIERALPLAWDILAPGGRLMVISFHSLEDRIVKNFIKSTTHTLKNNKYKPISFSSGVYSENSNTLYENRVGVCLTKKPVIASVGEVKKNPASRSAKLRVLEKSVVK